jgi:hypothetical protein
MKSRILTSLTCGCLAILVAACSTELTGRLSAPVVDDSLRVSSSEVELFSAKATGVQIYECRADPPDSTHYEWALKAPEADLFDAKGKKLGRHYGGPTCEAIDGSKVVGEVKGRELSPDTNAIPWLLLSVKQHEGKGILSHVTSIQRLETVGGKAPAGRYDQSSLGKQIRVPYTTVYYFYVSSRVFNLIHI